MRRAPDYFVPRSLLSLETLRSAWRWGRAAVGPGKPPQPLGLWGDRTPGVAGRASPGSRVSPAALCLPQAPPSPPPPHSRGLMMETPRWRFPAPWEGASFRGRLRVPSTSPPRRQLDALRPTGLRARSQRGAALGTCPRRQKPGVPASGCSEAHGGWHASWGARGRRRAGSALGLGWVGGYLQLLRACACCFLLYGDVLGG